MHDEPKITEIYVCFLGGDMIDVYQRRSYKLLQMPHGFQRAVFLIVSLRQKQKAIQLRLFPCKAYILHSDAEERDFFL